MSIAVRAASVWIDGCRIRRLSAGAEVQAWQDRREATGGKIDRRFGAEDARIELKRLCPSLQE
jgi:hypothetical protein